MTRQQRLAKLIRDYFDANVNGNLGAWHNAVNKLADYVAVNRDRITIESDHAARMVKR